MNARAADVYTKAAMLHEVIRQRPIDERNVCQLVYLISRSEWADAVGDLLIFVLKHAHFESDEQVEEIMSMVEKLPARLPRSTKLAERAIRTLIELQSEMSAKGGGR